MLILNRKQGERVVIGEGVEVVVLAVHGNRVKLGFRGPAEVPIHRQELHRRIAAGRSDRPSVPRVRRTERQSVPRLVATE